MKPAASSLAFAFLVWGVLAFVAVRQIRNADRHAGRILSSPVNRLLFFVSRETPRERVAARVRSMGFCALIVVVAQALFFAVKALRD